MNNHVDVEEDSEVTERRKHGTLTEGEKQEIAQQAADLVWQRIYIEVGKSSIKSALFVLGAGVLALFAWLGLHKEIALGAINMVKGRK